LFGAIEKGDVIFFLELLKLHREGGLRNMAGIRSLSEVAMFVDSKEVL
jgi:hypothetical protein